MLSPATQAAIFAVLAQLGVFGLREGFLGAEYLLQQGAEEGAELVVVEGEVAHRRFGLAGGPHFDDGRVGFGGSPVDVEQGG